MQAMQLTGKHKTPYLRAYLHVVGCRKDDKHLKVSLYKVHGMYVYTTLRQMLLVK